MKNSKLNHDFQDLFTPTGHTCLFDLRRQVEERTDISDQEGVEALLHMVEMQLGGFIRGVLVGQTNIGAPKDVLEAVLENICPTCLTFWVNERQLCCLGCGIIDFVAVTMKDNVVAIDVDKMVAHKPLDPSLN